MLTLGVKHRNQPDDYLRGLLAHNSAFIGDVLPIDANLCQSVHLFLIILSRIWLWTFPSAEYLMQLTRNLTWSSEAVFALNSDGSVMRYCPNGESSSVSELRILGKKVLSACRSKSLDADWAVKCWDGEETLWLVSPLDFVDLSVRFIETCHVIGLISPKYWCWPNHIHSSLIFLFVPSVPRSSINLRGNGKQSHLESGVTAEFRNRISRCLWTGMTSTIR